MRSDFAVFILTHGRADNMVTLKTLKRGGYTGKVYFIIDDEDETGDRYRELYGPENVIVFNKQAAYDRADTMDTFNDHRAIIYARNESWRIAKNLGLRYFLMLDDDYADIAWRHIGPSTEDGRRSLLTDQVKDLDRAFELMLEFLEVTNADTVAFAQGGDFVGGLTGGNYSKGLLRKVMNSFFCRTDRPIEFKGTMNEDVVTYTTLNSQGRLLLSYTGVMIRPLPTQSLTGGMTEAYMQEGTYVKSFYAVMAMPSCVRVQMMTTAHSRIHHRVDWERCAPKILNEKWRKTR